MDAQKVRLRAQQKYIEHGFVLFKLRPNSKKPMEKWGSVPFRKKFKTRSNYGIVLQHNQLIIDVDPRNFKGKTSSFEKLIKEIVSEAKLTAIVVTHNPEQALRIGEKALLLADGKLIEHGTADEVINSPNTEIGIAYKERKLR